MYMYVEHQGLHTATTGYVHVALTDSLAKVQREIYRKAKYRYIRNGERESTVKQNLLAKAERYL